MQACRVLATKMGGIPHPSGSIENQLLVMQNGIFGLRLVVNRAFLCLTFFQVDWNLVDVQT
jgi:hypothetical protein